MSVKYTEAHLQALVVKQLRAFGWTVHGDQNAAKRTMYQAMQAKRTGMQKGWPDICVLLPEGKTLWIELKLKGNYATPEQKALHEVMRSLGHLVFIVTAENPNHAVEQVFHLLKAKDQPSLASQKLASALPFDPIP